MKKEKKKIGSKNAMWKGGTTKFKARIRGLRKYREWKKEILKRDGYSLKEAKRRKMQVHHLDKLEDILQRNNIKTITEARQCKELWNINNGVTLRKGDHYIITLIERQKEFSSGFIKYLENFVKEINKIIKKKQKALREK